MYSDERLIAEVKNGNSGYFRHIVSRYQSRVAATVVGMLGRGASAEDVGQETFIRLYQNLQNFRGDSSLGTYLTRIAINLSLNELKRQKRRHFFSIGNGYDEDGIDLPAEEKHYSDTKDHIYRALGRLDAKYRAVVTLRLINGYSTRETAEILDVPEGTVLSRLARGQEKLRKILAPIVEEI